MTSEDQPAVPASASPSLANRYGGQKRALSRRAKGIIVAAALASGIGFLAWSATSGTSGSVSFKDLGYSTRDATLTEADFQVTKEPTADAKCAVKALDEKFGVVGWKVIDIGPNPASEGSDGGRTTVHRAMIRTESQAVSAVVDNCWIPAGSK